jgi:hypothetical protein
MKRIEVVVLALNSAGSKKVKTMESQEDALKNVLKRNPMSGFTLQERLSLMSMMNCLSYARKTKRMK